MVHNRDPQNVQAWLVGGGVASLAAAVFLINQANVPPHHVHILDIHHGSGGAMKTSGNSRDGYVLHTGAQPYFHEECVKDLLSMSEKGPYYMDMHKLGIGTKLRMDLIKFIVDGEKCFDSKRINDVFDEGFFNTEFWMLWSTTFMLQKWHSASEFHRLLTKYLLEMHTHNDVRELDRTQFSLYESLIIPITSYLKEKGVDFRFHAMVTNLELYPASDPTTVSEIIMEENGKEVLVTVDPIDIVIVTLGSMASGMQTGSNSEPPASLSPDIMKCGEWLLWEKLGQQSLKFGNPPNFSSRPDESKIETFTVTLHDSDFMKLYTKLTSDKPGTGALLTIMESPWGLNISVPHQPVFATQSKICHVIWGYALHPEMVGRYVKKSMEDCSGAEIFVELLSHLGFPIDPLLSTSITIPCLMPLGTSMLLSRTHQDRPRVIPHNTTNIALIGQYVEIPNDTSLSVEYSVRGAQVAVCELMGLPHTVPKIWKNKLLEVFELLL
ncbi:uncharacterized protein N7469_002298 [Penicillium citrinum]|uniref:Oleate hydratase n=1 Tax=Penicillium citrinum TaxID=5077 RepID=A0A9W9PAA1_PENCI|nr:uncharacterized protein N7469_002298 [Penicillium citrinum]KAJ5240707.1 hypothetical protein N7469_002298 [Penicillium citrinum]